MARGQGQGATIEFDGSGPEAFNQGTYGRSETETAQGRGPFGGAFGGGVFGANGTSDGHGRSSGADQGRNETTRTIEWETLIGEVTAVDSKITFVSHPLSRLDRSWAHCRHRLQVCLL